MTTRYVIFLSLALPILLSSQTTFSYRDALGTPFCVFTGIESLDNGHIRVYGYAEPPTGGRRTGIIFIELDPNGGRVGDPESVFYIDKEINLFAKGESYDGHYYHGGFVKDTLFKAAVFEIEGDTSQILIEAVSEDVNSFIFTYIDVAVDSASIFACGYERIFIDENTSLHRNALDKYDRQGHKEWSINFGNETNWSYFGLSVIKHENVLLVGGLRSNSKFREVNKRVNANIWAFDTTGQMLWQWESPRNERYWGAWDMLPTSDDGLVVASAYGREVVTSAGYGFLEYQPCVFKLNAEREMVWQTQFRDNVPSSDHQLNRIIAVSDGSGYVVTGRSSIYFPDNDPQTENPGDIGGIIAKVSPEGDSLWSRILIHPGLPSFIEQGHLYDVKETPDGGFVLAGYSNHNLTDPSTQGWIIKVDEYGCLVPGCHLVSDTQEATVEEIDLLLSPNPTSDLLHVYVGHRRSYEEQALIIYDLRGQVVQRYPLAPGAATYLLEVGHLPAGQYFVQLQAKSGKRSLAKAFVVQ